MDENLHVKVNRAIKLIQSAGKIAKEHGQPLEVAYSGGKDSDVILELTKMSGVDYRAIYKNTTIDPAGTIRHAQEMGAEILRPKEGFFYLVERMGFPNMFKRFCCGRLKEYKVLDYAVVGVRRDESRKRADRYKEPEACRVYSKKSKCRQYYPILDWTAQDIADFVSGRGIKCHSLYYDDEGTFHPERRLGCMGCPMLDKKRIEQFKSHPNLVKAWLRAGQKYRNTHPNVKSVRAYNDVFEWFVRDVFYWRKSQEEWEEMNNNPLLPHPNYRKYLEDYFGIDLNSFTKNKV